MTAPTPPDMAEATRLTRAGRLSEATSLLRGLLQWPPPPRGHAAPMPARPRP